MTPRITAAGMAAAAVAVLALASCSSQPSPPIPDPASPSTPSASSVPALPTSPITGTHVFADGLTIGVAEITEAKLGMFPQTDDPEAEVEEGDPYVIVTLQWTNRSTAPIELMPVVTVRVGADGQQAPRVSGNDARDAITIDPGGSDQYDVGFLVTDDDRKQVAMEIIDAQEPSRAVALTGSLTT
jgi:hypothetical protein